VIYWFFGLIPGGVVAAVSTGTYPQYTEAIPVFTTSQVVEGPQVVLIKSAGNSGLEGQPKRANACLQQRGMTVCQC
jgi:hypothetical protein